MKIYICGHRNPDTDSITSAYALADLRMRTGMENVEPICAGNLTPRAKWIFNHFNLPPIRTKRDIYLRVEHIMDESVPMIDGEMKLEDALKRLLESGESSLPVKAADGTFLGMLSPAKLLDYFIARGDLSIKTKDANLHRCAQILTDTDRVHDIKKACLKNSHNHFPVVDKNGKLRGTLLKRAFAEEPPRRIILVDHNEVDQGIPGLEEIPVVEVVDHHRIAFMPTKDPIRYTADVVGSTCTLVARMYRAAGERPAKGIAGVLICGIIADTLMFQSPTTTEADKTMCAWLEKLAGESAADIWAQLSEIDSPLKTMGVEAAIMSDAKRYHEGGKEFIVAQIEETHMSFVHKHAQELQAAVDQIVGAEKLDFMALMVTDPVRGYSEMFFSGDKAVRHELPYKRGEWGTLVMPGILSRKKQLLPEIISAIS